MTDHRFGRTLFVGGTGMLANVSRVLANRSDQLWLAARKPEPLAEKLGARAIPLDWNAPEMSCQTIRRLPEIELLITWLHDAGTWMALELEDRVKPGGRSIRIHGSDSKDPSVRTKRNPGQRRDILRQTVILGWVNLPAGRRWLTHGEICAGVIEALNRPLSPLIVAGCLDD